MNRKQGLRAFGLSILAVLGLMAFAVGGAQGSGKVLVQGLASPFTVGITGSEDEPVGDRLRILGLSMEVFCNDAEISGLLINSGHGQATIVLKGCQAHGIFEITGALKEGESTCSIPNITVTALALIVLHAPLIIKKGAMEIKIEEQLFRDGSGGGTEHRIPTVGDPYLLLTPLDGLTFAKVTNPPPSECALPETANLKGCVVASVVTSGDQVTHLVTTKKMLELFGCTLNYGTNVAHLEVDALVSLANSVHGNHAGLIWGLE